MHHLGAVLFLATQDIDHATPQHFSSDDFNFHKASLYANNNTHLPCQ